MSKANEAVMKICVSLSHPNCPSDNVFSVIWASHTEGFDAAPWPRRRVIPHKLSHSVSRAFKMAKENATTSRNFLVNGESSPSLPDQIW